LIVMGLAPAGASSANISRSFHASSAIDNGSLVSLDPQRTDYVEASSVDNGASLLGVAVASNDSLIAVDPTTGAIQVATSGIASVLVSDVNGDIHVGDQIAVSPFNGIGMKTLPGSHVIGLAQNDFSAGSAGATTEQVKDKGGKTSSIKIGYIRVNIAITTVPFSNPTARSSLQSAAQSLAGHPISFPRIMISVVVALVALLALVVLIYGSIYGSIVSIGRNPLAKYAIFRTLGSVLGMAVMTAVIAGVTIFLLLR
jgi:hypothetical protein